MRVFEAIPCRLVRQDSPREHTRLAIGIDTHAARRPPARCNMVLSRRVCQESIRDSDAWPRTSAAALSQWDTAYSSARGASAVLRGRVRPERVFGGATPPSDPHAVCYTGGGMEPKTKLLDQVRDAIRRIGQTKGIFAPSHCKRIPLERPSVPPRRIRLARGILTRFA